MKKIVIGSDLHLDVDFTYLRNSLGADVLILAGDTCSAASLISEKFLDFFRVLSKEFPQVYLIGGNHEHYRMGYFDTNKKIKKFLTPFTNIEYLDNETRNIDDRKFIFTTLWSYIPNKHRFEVESKMNDFRYIYNKDFTPITASFINDVYRDNVRFLEKELEGVKDAYVITHHAPSFKSLHKDFEGDNLNCAFLNSLDDLIKKYSIKLWVHGHTHSRFDYKLEDTRILCNPRGYPGDDSSKQFFLKSI